MLVVRLILQLVLFVVFLFMYGLPALARLNKQSTIVIKTRIRNADGIQAPSFTISARGRATGMGWREKRISNAHSNDTIVHQCKGFSTVEQCLDSQTFASTDFIKGTLIGYERKLSLKDEVWKQDFTYVRYGRSYTFHPEMRIGPEDDKDQLIILLDSNYCYDIFVHEKNFFILNDNRCTLPSNYVKLIPDASNHSKVYYKISATQHIEKNVPQDPCVEDDQYNFGVCVKESLARKVGCKPSWDVWSDQTIRNCTEIDEHRYAAYSYSHSNVSSSTSGNLNGSTT